MKAALALAALLAVAAIVAGVFWVNAGDGGRERPYTASATITCVRAEAALLVQPSRAAAREVRHGPARARLVGISRSGSTIGAAASGGDYQLTTYPDENVLYFHFTGSRREARALLHGYWSNFASQIGARTAHRMVYRRRNVVVEWDDRPSRAERRVADQCLRSARSRLRAHRRHPAAQPRRLSGSPQPGRLIPADAVVSHVWRVPAGGGFGAERAVSWQRVALVGSRLETQGLAIWQQSGRSWRLVYSLRLPRELGFLHARRGDVNGDGHDDLLLFEDLGGSAGCGLYRLLSPMRDRVRQLLVRDGCSDYTRAWIRRGSLVLYQGVVKDPRTLDQIHCCWTTWLRTARRWRGREIVSVVRRRVRRPPARLYLRSSY